MKKVLLFVAIATAASFASCKKDHTCSCTTTGSTTADVTTYPSSTKKAAQSHCLSSTQTYSGVVVTKTCTLN